MVLLVGLLFSSATHGQSRVRVPSTHKHKLKGIPRLQTSNKDAAHFFSSLGCNRGYNLHFHTCSTTLPSNSRFSWFPSGSAAAGRSTKTAASKVTTVALNERGREGGSQGENSGPDVAPLQTLEGGRKRGSFGEFIQFSLLVALPFRRRPPDHLSAGQSRARVQGV